MAEFMAVRQLLHVVAACCGGGAEGLCLAEVAVDLHKIFGDVNAKTGWPVRVGQVTTATGPILAGIVQLGVSVNSTSESHLTQPAWNPMQWMGSAQCRPEC